jgi:stage II sporulation protein D
MTGLGDTVRKLLLLTATFILLAPIGAQAATRVVIKGAGFGHGIGLSQYGAYGYAQHGFSYKEIIRHYYRGASIGQSSRRGVKVLLQSGRSSVSFRGATGISGKAASPSRIYVARARGGSVVVSVKGGHRLGRFSAPLRVSSTRNAMRLYGSAINGVTSGLYRGGFLLTPSGSRLTVVNSLGIDSYVQGVVPGEMPSSWSREALKAQAVVARTYALATIKPGHTFDLYPDTRSQMYRGASGEAFSTNSATQATAGQAVAVGGHPVITYYFSTSGGKTEDVQNVFFGSLARSWLKGVDDPFDGISPRHRWRMTFTAAGLGKRVGLGASVRKVKVLSRGFSPRIIRARFYSRHGSRTLTGPSIRSALGLFDSWAYFHVVSSSQAGRSARVSLSGPVFPPLALLGSFDPAPRSQRLAVERRSGRGWRRVGSARTRRGGRYRVRVPRPGTYRVRAGTVAGPAVRVR